MKIWKIINIIYHVNLVVKKTQNEKNCWKLWKILNLKTMKKVEKNSIRKKKKIVVFEASIIKFYCLSKLQSCLIWQEKNFETRRFLILWNSFYHFLISEVFNYWRIFSMLIKKIIILNISLVAISNYSEVLIKFSAAHITKKNFSNKYRNKKIFMKASDR